MTVALLAGFAHYQGTSVDDKPTEGIVTGSTFRETDTGATFVYDGATWKQTWVTVAGPDGKPIGRETNIILEELLLETKLLRHGLVLQGIVEDIGEPAL